MEGLSAGLAATRALLPPTRSWCLEQGRTSAWPDDIKSGRGYLAQAFPQLQTGLGKRQGWIHCLKALWKET